ncbi:MAG: hypothetical protein HOQ02_04030 [Lysobacter sp.]|nr:hypothetical protein [Lysobacter sp.]
MFPAAVVLSEEEREVLRLLNSPWGDLDGIERDVLERLALLHYAHDRFGNWELTQAGRRALAR